MSDASAVQDIPPQQGSCDREALGMKMLVERVADYAIFLLDVDGRIVTWNPAAERMKGYREDEVIGQHVSILYPDDDAKAKLPERNLKIAADEGFYRGEGRRRRKNGDVFEAEIEITRLSEGGRITGYAKIVRDISGRARDRERLRLANEDLADFASIAAHDLQEPLRMIANYLALHLRRSAGALDEQSRGYVTQAIDGTRRMQTLTAYLIALARVGSDAAPMVPVDMASAWQEAIDTLGISIREAGAAITADALPPALGHRAYLVELYQSLLSNAVKYRRPDVKPVIHASAAAKDDGRTIVFTVSDNGIGIKPEDLQRIFRPFERLHTHGEFPGAGLGLAMADKIIRHHGGRAWVDSEVGRGSSFHFTLTRA